VRTTNVKKIGFLLAAGLLICGPLASAGPASARQRQKAKVVEKETTVAGPFSSATRAVNEAKKYSGKTLNVVWEAGLVSQDPFTMGPKWEQLTGIKIKVVDMSYNNSIGILPHG
jgi:ABC-type phosphate/phosphonate transport system substrate-binding protein